MTEKTTKEPTKYARLTPRQWAQAEALWEGGEMTLEELAKKYGKDVSTFAKHFAAKGIKRGVKAVETKARIDEELAKAAAAEMSVIAGRIRETKEEHYKMAAGLAKLTWAEVLKAKQDGAPVSVAINNLKALDTAMSVLKKAREERYAVLGLDRDDSNDEDLLPQLVVQELTPEQVEALQSRDESELDDLELEIVGDSADSDSDEG